MHIIFYSTWYAESRNCPGCQNIVSFSALSFSRDPCITVLSPQPWPTCLRFPLQPSLRAANHIALGLELLSLYSQIYRNWFTPPNTFGFWFRYYFSCRLPEMKSCFTKSPCHLALPTYLQFTFSQLPCSSHLGSDNRHPWGYTEFHNPHMQHNFWPGALFTEKFTILCFLPSHLSENFSFEF